MKRVIAPRDVLEHEINEPGATVELMAKRHRVSATLMRAWLDHYDLQQPRPTDRPARGPDRDVLRGVVYEPGTTMESLARRFGVSVTTARVWLVDHQLPTPAKVHGNANKGLRIRNVDTNSTGRCCDTWDVEYLAHAYLVEQRTLADIGAELGATRQRIGQVLKREGIDARQRKVALTLPLTGDCEVLPAAMLSRQSPAGAAGSTA